MMPSTDNQSLRAIDLALAAFLKRQFPAADAAHCQLAALVSLQLAEGHTCLPLDNDASRQLVRDCCGRLAVAGSAARPVGSEPRWQLETGA